MIPVASSKKSIVVKITWSFTSVPSESVPSNTIWPSPSSTFCNNDAFSSVPSASVPSKTIWLLSPNSSFSILLFSSVNKPSTTVVSVPSKSVNPEGSPLSNVSNAALVISLLLLFCNWEESSVDSSVNILSNWYEVAPSDSVDSFTMIELPSSVWIPSPISVPSLAAFSNCIGGL